MLTVLDSDSLGAVLACLDSDTLLAASLTCTSMNTARRQNLLLRTNANVMFSKNETLLWSMGLGCPLRTMSVDAALDAMRYLRQFQPTDSEKYARSMACFLKHAHADVYMAAAQSFGCVKPDALTCVVHIVSEFLLDDTWHVRVAALVALASMGGSWLDSRADEISAMITDTHWRVRECAVDAMSKMGGAVLACISGACVQRLKGFPWYVRAFATAALCTLRPNALALMGGDISDLLADPDACVRHEAVLAMRKLGSVALSLHACAIAQLLNDPEMRTRVRAVRILETLSALRPACLAQHVSAISGVLLDSDEFVRCAALCALRKIEGSN